MTIEALPGQKLSLSDGLVVVTGGASFIGSHLVDRLVAEGCRIRVVDDLSSGLLENIATHVQSGRVQFVQADLLDPGAAESAVTDAFVVFHLAANHGGRGYIDLHQAACASNLLLDAALFRACQRGGVSKVIYASSGCVYPMSLQMNLNVPVVLKETMVGPPYDADGMYGWAKLMGEMTLRALYRDYGMQSVACRYFTVYGERCQESHAITAMIARAFIKETPFAVWGNGDQIRNWTHVDDIVTGTVLAAKHIGNACAVNLGTMEATRVIDAAREIMRYTCHEVPIEFRNDSPVGPLVRVADNSLAREWLGWAPRVAFADGLRRTIEWYFATNDRDEVRASIRRRLLERT